MCWATCTPGASSVRGCTCQVSLGPESPCPAVVSRLFSGTVPLRRGTLVLPPVPFLAFRVRFPGGVPFFGLGFRVSPWLLPLPGECQLPGSGFGFPLGPSRSTDGFLFSSPGPLVALVSVPVSQEELSALRSRFQLPGFPLAFSVSASQTGPVPSCRFIGFPLGQFASRCASRSSAPFPASGFPLGLLRFRFPGCIPFCRCGFRFSPFLRFGFPG